MNESQVQNLYRINNLDKYVNSITIQYIPKVLICATRTNLAIDTKEVLINKSTVQMEP